MTHSSDDESVENPKDQIGSKKVPLHCVPAEVLLELGLAMEEGARKYGAWNFRAVGVRASVYYDAVMRHMFSWWESEDIDPDSGVNHLVKAMACLVVLRDSMNMGNWKDDRPMRLPKGANVSELNAIAAKLVEKYPNAAQAFTEVKA